MGYKVYCENCDGFGMEFCMKVCSEFEDERKKNGMEKCICNLEEDEGMTIDEGCWTYLKLNREYEGFYIEAWGDDVASMRINYCPKCGRKLSDD